MQFRTAGLEDIKQISEIRKKQIQDEGQKPVINIDEDLHRYFEENLRSGKLIEWVAEEDGRIIATAAIVFMEFPPSFTNKSGQTGYVANVYTADEYRGRGIAGELLEKVEQEAEKRGITQLLLHASELGRKAYIKSGYEDVDIEMEKNITPKE